MQRKINVIDSCKQEIEFDIPADELTPHFEKAYLRYRNKVTVPGFRKGKAPLSMIKKLYGEALQHESLEHIASETFNRYLKEENVHMLGEGSITDMNYNHGQNFTFKIQFEVKPEFELKKYKGLTVTKPVHDVDDRMVEEEIKYLKAKHANYELAEKAEDDDFVITLNMQKLDSAGLPIIGYKQENIRIYLNDVNLEEELRSQLRGIASGESRIIKLKNREKKEHETYSAKVVKTEKIIYPELNIEFFKRVAKKDIPDLASFKEFLHEDLSKIYDRISEQELENNIISELIKSNDIPVPDTLVDNILNSRLDDIRKKNPRRELPEGFNDEEFRKNNRVDAILQVKWYLVRDKIIETEKLKVSDEEIEKAVQDYSARYSLPAEKVRGLFRKNEDMKYDLLNTKLMQLLKENADIKEVRHTHEEDSRIYA